MGKHARACAAAFGSRAWTWQQLPGLVSIYWQTAPKISPSASTTSTVLQEVAALSAETGKRSIWWSAEAVISVADAALPSRQPAFVMPPMPLVSPTRLTDVLLADGSGLVPQTDDGGLWRVEACRSARRLLARRILVAGTRVASDRIAANSVTLPAPRPRSSAYNPASPASARSTSLLRRERR